MSDFEDFEITPEDLAPQKRKRQTKEEALYGVFFQDNEDAEVPDAHKPLEFGATSRLDTSRTPDHSTVPSQSPLEAKALQEMYGKGFQMLQKAGFKVGQGLGKQEQGTIAPVALQVRRKNEGLHLTKTSKEANTSKPSTGKRWQKDFHRPNIRSRDSLDLDALLRQYRAECNLAEEVVETHRTADSAHSPLSLEDAWKRCRQEVLETERKIRHHQDVLVSVAYDATQTKQSLETLTTRLSQLSDLSQFVTDRLDAPLDLQALLQLCQTISSRFPTLWEDLDALRRVALPMALKQFSAGWQKWSVRSDNLSLFAEARAWTEWLGDAASSLFIEWERSLQRFIQTRWKPREESGSLIDAVEAWKSVMPQDVMGRVKGCLFDALRTELDRWEPTKDKIPVHTWLHPWLAVLDLQELWPKILQKLAKALHQWQPEDESAFALLAPWQPVLGKLWEPFYTRHILPKLAHALTQIEINPRQQDISVFLRVMDWAEIIPATQFSEVLKADFYPKWRQTLEAWLSDIDESSLEEVQTWYEGWQSIVPKQLLDFSEAFHSA